MTRYLPQRKLDQGQGQRRSVPSPSLSDTCDLCETFPSPSLSFLLCERREAGQSSSRQAQCRQCTLPPSICTTVLRGKLLHAFIRSLMQCLTSGFHRPGPARGVRIQGGQTTTAHALTDVIFHKETRERPLIRHSATKERDWD